MGIIAAICPFCGHETDYLTVGQVAGLFGVAKKTVRRWIGEGRFPGTLPVRGMTSPMMFKIPASAVLPLVKERDETQRV